MRALAILLCVLGLAACGGKDKPAPVLMTPGSRLIYHDGQHGLWTICDRGTKVYLTHGGVVQAVPGGCPDGQP